MTTISMPAVAFPFPRAAIVAVASILALCPGSAPGAATEIVDRFAPSRDEPALLGHAAEAAMREAEAEARHRRLFFDPAERESGEPGVACDHRTVTRPESIAGRGRVLVAVDATTGRVVARLWVPPDPTGRPALDEAAARSRLLHAAHPTPASAMKIEMRDFAWCR